MSTFTHKFINYTNTVDISRSQPNTFTISVRIRIQVKGFFRDPLHCLQKTNNLHIFIKNLDSQYLLKHYYCILYLVHDFGYIFIF